MSTTGYFPSGSQGKASAYNAGDQGSIPGSRRSPGKGNGNPLQHSCLENGGAWQATVHGRLQSMAGYGPWGCKKSDTTEQLHFHFQLRLQDQGLNLCMQVLELLK